MQMRSDVIVGAAAWYCVALHGADTFAHTRSEVAVGATA